MEWIKRTPHLLALAILAVGLIGASVMVLLNAQGLPERFASVQAPVTPNNKIPPLELEPVKQAEQRVKQPSQWNPDTATAGSVFIPEAYTLKNGVPEKVSSGGIADRVTAQMIPATWFLENHLGNPLDPNIGAQDADRDGFLNEDEWREKTNPNDPKSYPAYHTKLFLKQFIRVPFRLLFNAYDEGNSKKKIAATFQINTLDLKSPSVFLAIGEKVPKTPYQLEKFEKKAVLNPKTGEETDVSELTVANTETGDRVALVLAKITDSPESVALFSYQWPNPAIEFTVKKFGEFVLLPNKTERYKVLDIQETGAVIQLPSGQKYTVPKLPASLR